MLLVVGVVVCVVVCGGGGCVVCFAVAVVAPRSLVRWKSETDKAEDVPAALATDSATRSQRWP